MLETVLISLITNGLKLLKKLSYVFLCLWLSKQGKFQEKNKKMNDFFDRSSRRKRGMASNPLFIIPDFFLHFPNELSYGYLRFKGNGKIPLGR